MAKNFIRINVGGSLFSTLRSTLTKEPDSMLARMIDTKVPTETDSDGNIFIVVKPSIFILSSEKFNHHFLPVMPFLAVLPNKCFLILPG